MPDPCEAGCRPAGRLPIGPKAAAAITISLTLTRALAAGPEYHSPVELAVSTDTARLYVVCEASDRVLALDTTSGTIAATIPTGRAPRGIALSRDGRRAWVPNSWSDTVSEFDPRGCEILRHLKAGFEPVSAVADRDARYLYTANRIGGDISVIDLATGRETKRLVAGKGASYLTLSPDGRHIYGTHIYPNPGPFRAPPESEITVIDTVRQVVETRRPLRGSAGVFHSALSADGRILLAAQMRPRNLIPLAHVAHGWVITNSLAFFTPDLDEPVHIPIDELDRYFTPPFDIAITPDASAAFVSTTGSDSVTVIDLARLRAFIRAATPARLRTLANDLSASAHYVAARIPVGRAPRGLALSPDGTRLYAANRNDDTISVIDTRTRRVTAVWNLAGPRELTPARRGERLFYTARYAFQGQFGCANCHIDGTMDGLSWDLAPDGFGIDIVDNRLVEDVAETAPFKWNGGNPDLETECGPRTETWFYRARSYSPAELADLVAYIRSIPPRPNRYRTPTGELTPQQERGKLIFDREKTRDGNPVPEASRCGTCHSGERYTNRAAFDVGTGKPTDRSPVFDVPHLTNLALSAPYLHDGSARSLEEIWTVFNPADRHGATNDLTKDELNDLIEYLKTL